MLLHSVTVSDSIAERKVFSARQFLGIIAE
ncbi:hypothetical protein ABIA39_002592 [Nocardia sp. GAS34]